MRSPLYLLFLAFLVRHGSSFTPKSECLIDYNLGEEGEYEGEEGGGWDGPWSRGGGDGGPHGAYPGRHLTDSEDWRERMGMDEMEDFGYTGLGQGHRGEGYGHTGYGGEDYRGPGPAWPTDFTPNADRRGTRYMDEEAEWEDARRKRKRRQIGGGRYLFGRRSKHTRQSLNGKLTCASDAMIHIHNMTVGYSNSRYCRQALPGCQASSSSAKQVIHCQGNSGTCNINIRRHFMARCGQFVNFAEVLYECIPGPNHVDICSNTNRDVKGAIVITSPSYPSSNRQQSASNRQIDTCECTLRGVAQTQYQLEYLRTHLPGKENTCDGDMLLLERPDPAQDGRYLMEHEYCGLNSNSSVTINDNILRVTFLGGAPLAEGKTGFIAKFKAVTTEGNPELFHLSCEGTPTGADPVPTAARGAMVSESRSTQTAQLDTAKGSAAYANRLLDLMNSNGRTIPSNFNLANLPPNFFNMSRDELQARMSRARAQSQRVVGEPVPMVKGIGDVNDVEDSNSSSGVLSGVVASLASVITIMGSLGTYVLYRRHQKKKREQEEMNRYAVPCHYNNCSADSARDHNSGPHEGELPQIPAALRQLSNHERRHGGPIQASTSSQHRSSGRFGAARMTLSKLVGAGKAILGSRAQVQNDAKGNSVYCVATSIDQSPSEMTCSAEVHNEDVGSNPISHHHTESPPLDKSTINARDSVASKPVSSPVAPPRRKRKNKMDTYDEDYSSSAYDNAGFRGSILSSERQTRNDPQTNQVEVTEYSFSYPQGDPRLDKTRACRRHLHKESGPNHNVPTHESGFGEEEQEEHYSSISEMQSAVLSLEEPDKIAV